MLDPIPFAVDYEAVRYHDAGEAHVHLSLVKQASDATTVQSLVGRLISTDKNWVLLTVPNALVRGMFDALHEIGAELPLKDGKLTAHISVARPEEIEQIGGIDKLTELGHQFKYGLGPVKTCVPDGWKEMAQVWFAECKSSELDRLRRSYGLGPPKYPYHITFATRRAGTIATNSEVSKAAATDVGHYTCPKCGAMAHAGDPETGVKYRGSAKCVGCGSTFSVVHMKQAAIKCDKYVKGECCPNCCARLERDPYNGKCNTCGKDWPLEKSAIAELAYAAFLNEMAVIGGKA